jgi:hypothetical protein
MTDYKMLEELVSSLIKIYEEGFNKFNSEFEVRFNMTITNHRVEVEGMSRWVAYLRLEKMVRPKGGTDEEWEHLLIYNQAYKFKNAGERANPETPWKKDLYMDLLTRLVAGGLEYSELLKRMQAMTKNSQGKPIAEIVTPKEPDLIITDQMPEPLTDKEKEYLDWIKKNNENYNK